MKLLEQVGHWLGVSDDLADQRHEQQRFAQLLTSLFVMGWFVEARDPYTGGHLWRVSRYSRLLAEAGGLNQVEVASIGLGGFLHDLGKIGIPDAILTKAGPLTKDEYAIIKTHPDIGARLLEAHPLEDIVRYAVHLHHERPDGLGYPLGREQHAGDTLFCRNCGGEFILVSRNGALTATPTGRTGSAAVLQPKADAALISRAVSSAVVVMPVPGLMKLVDSHSFRMTS